MQLIRVVFAFKPPRNHDEHDVVRIADALWAHARQEDDLEHVSGRAGHGAVEIVLFLRESVSRAPDERAAKLINRAYQNSHFMRAAFDVPRGCESLNRFLDKPDRERPAFGGSTAECPHEFNNEIPGT